MSRRHRIHRLLSVEELEARIAPATVLTIAGTAGDDDILLCDNGVVGDGTFEIRINGLPTITFGGIDQIIVNGGDGDDTLTVDFTGENPIPALGLTINGEGNGAAGDSLILTGGAFTAQAINFTSSTDGTIDLDTSQITFSGLEPVIDTVPSVTLTVNATDAANTIVLDDGTAGGDGRLRVAIAGFESIEFSNKTNLIINAGITGADLGDTVTVNCTENATGLATITVNGDEGDDSITLLSPPPGPTINLNGNAGNDTISAATIPLGLSVDGGSGVNIFHIDTGVGDDTVTVSIDLEQVDVNGTVADFLNIADIEIADGGGDDTLNYDNSMPGQLFIYGPNEGSIADLSGPFVPGVMYWDFEHVLSLSSLFRLLVNADADPAPGSQMNDGTADTFLVSLDPTGTDLEVYVNSVWVHSGPLSQYSQFLCLGSTDDDTLVVDSANGLIVLPQYVSIEGFGGSNSLILQGDPGIPILRETYESGPSIGLGAGDGNIIFDPDDNAGPFSNLFNLNGDEQVIRFFGLSPIVDTTPALQLDIFGAPGIDSVDVQDGPGAGGFTTTRISHAGNLFESIEFANKTTVTFSAMNGMDEFIVNNPNPADGLAVLDLYGNELTGGTINPDDNQNEFFQVSAMGAAVTLGLFGQGGDDHFGLGEWAGLLDNLLGPVDIVGGTTGEINGDQWFLIDRDSLIDDLITFTDSTITGASASPISYSEIEELFYDAPNWANVTLDILSSPAGMFSFIELTYDSYIGTATVGNATADFGDGTGDLSAILGQVQLDFTFTGYGILQIDDTGDTTGKTATITDVGPGVVIAGLSPIAITYADAPGPFGGDLDEFALMTGSGNDTIILNDVTALVRTTIDTGDGDDLLRRDFTSGVPNLPMTFHGGPGSDSMELSNGAADLVRYTFANANDGQVEIASGANTSVITFTGLEPILDLVVATDREFVFPDTDDAITLSDDPTPNDNYSQISSVSSSETVTFLNPNPMGLLIVHGDNGGAGNDQITVGLLDGQLASQVIVSADDGDDTVVVNPSPTAFITADGGNGTDTFRYVGPGTPPPTPPNGTWTQAGFQDVIAQNFEWNGSPGKIVELAGGQVILYDMDAPNPASSDVDASDVRIRLDRTGSVIGVTLVGNPTGLGILINPIGASPVSVVDYRKGAPGALNDLSFVACMNDSRAMLFRSGLTGVDDLGSLIAAEGIIIDPDLDGDGTTADATALFSSGYLMSFRAIGDVTGDLVAGGADWLGWAARSVQVYSGLFSGDLVARGGLMNLFFQGGTDGAAIWVEGDLNHLVAVGAVTDTFVDIAGDVASSVVVNGMVDNSAFFIGGRCTAAIVTGPVVGSSFVAFDQSYFQAGSLLDSFVVGVGRIGAALVEATW